MLFTYVNAIIKNKPCDYRLQISLKTLAQTELDLLRAEDEVKKISLYLWLSYKLPEIFFDTQKAFRTRITVNQYCEDSLKLNLAKITKSKQNQKRNSKNSRGRNSRNKNNKKEYNRNYRGNRRR
jgi:ATP-dependent RNA helicase SUPV3L1/SUV3